MKRFIVLTLAALAATSFLPMTAAFADGPSDEARSSPGSTPCAPPRELPPSPMTPA
jgi:hypothetical protein